MKLTEVEFWNHYWSETQVPVEVDMEFSFERCLGKKLKDMLYKNEGQVLEIGCAPGKWMAFLAKQIGLLPSGIEYSAVGVEATKKNLSALNVKYGFIQDGDFFSIPPEPIFDVVMSLGFVEHFENPDEVILRHLQWLKSGGTLIIGVPNFRGVYNKIQGILDDSILKKHNLEIMRKEYFESIIDKYSLEMNEFVYLGSFEPSLPIYDDSSRSYKQLSTRALIKVARFFRKFKWWDQVNHPFISSYILVKYIKR